MNMLYSGIGIARSLGEHGVPVIGLSSQRRAYGHFTRYAKVRQCPDSRNEPEALLPFLLQLGEELGAPSVIFPTRDDDVLFLDRFRRELESKFILTIPESAVLNACLNKWETYQWARRAAVTAPKCWLIETEADVHRVLEEITYPCVAKPVSTHHWRREGNWNLVGCRKAIGIGSREELVAEYAALGRADQRLLLQAMVPGADDNLVIAACYLNRDAKWVAGFNTRKLLQIPEGFGTGCIVQAADRTELFDSTARLLETMRYTGIAEVEYKWDEAKREFHLIEINPRPWDQHRLGPACGVDVIYLAYCEHAGLPVPAIRKRPSNVKWIAEDSFLLAALQLIRRRDPKLRRLLELARGKRIYAIWSMRDPLPWLAYMIMLFIPYLAKTGASWLVRKGTFGASDPHEGDPIYQRKSAKG